MAQRFPQGSPFLVKTAYAQDAWPDGASKEVIIKQPANTYLVNVLLRAVSAPTFGASGSSVDCGAKISTTADGGEIYDDADGLINAAASTTPIAANAVWEFGGATGGVLLTDFDDPDATSTSIAASEMFTSTERDLYFQTSTTAAANTATNADVEWVAYFAPVPAPSANL